MAGFDMKSISVIEPSHKQYAEMDVTLDSLSSRHTSSRFYNEVVEALNSNDEGAILIVPLPEKIKYYNIRNVLDKRGLKSGVDIIISRQEVGPDGDRLPSKIRPAKIKKISKAQGRIIDSYPKSEEDG